MELFLLSDQGRELLVTNLYRNGAGVNTDRDLFPDNLAKTIVGCHCPGPSILHGYLGYQDRVIRGLNHSLPIDNIKGVVLPGNIRVGVPTHADLQQDLATFLCINNLVNYLQLRGEGIWTGGLALFSCAEVVVITLAP